MQNLLMNPLFNIGAGLASNQNMGQGIMQGLLNAHQMKNQHEDRQQQMNRQKAQDEYRGLLTDKARFDMNQAKIASEQKETDKIAWQSALAANPELAKQVQGLPMAQQQAIFNQQLQQQLNPALKFMDFGGYVGGLDKQGNLVKRMEKTLTPQAAAKAANPTFSAPENQASSFAHKMRLAEANMQKIQGENKDFDPSSTWEHMKEGLPFGNHFISDNFQNHLQAQRDWVSAKLRDESGAAIGVEEMNSEIIKYFPQPGDSAATIKQKQMSRKSAMEGMLNNSNGAYAKQFGAYQYPTIETLDERTAPQGKVNVDRSGYSSQKL